MRQHDRISVVGLVSTFILALPNFCATVFAKDSHWSFIPPMAVNIPKIENDSWMEAPVDAFILEKLESRGIAPAPAETKARIIRRLSFDLTGLPPTYQDVRAFLTDASPNAYENLVDRLLASPNYGERWAQHWLDVVRYADSDGFEYDTPRESAWRYRDWVIRAFDEDRPYDQFVAEQIGTDNISKDDPRNLIPTGLHRLGPLRENAGNQDLEKNRQELLVEMTDAIGSAFLGLTIGCAKCHDHKFDPISQEEYYRLQAFFAATIPADLTTASEAQVRAHRQRTKQWESDVQTYQAKIANLEKAARSNKSSSEDQNKIDQLNAELKARLMQKPKPLATIMAVRDKGPDVPETFVLVRGVSGNHGKKVQPGFPESLGLSVSSESEAVSIGKNTSRRSALARWLTAADHPLTARVIVNRIWQHHFGRGIVATPNDFGKMGAPPSHPELLDWLTIQFINSGWSIKYVQRLILTSATYRQSTRVVDTGTRLHERTLLFGRVPEKRLDAESLRDAVLKVSGEFNSQRFGPGIRFQLTKEISDAVYKGSWTPTKDPAEHLRRSIYRFVKRNIQPTLFAAFDAPDTLVSCGQRSVSTHAGQALTLFNGPLLEKRAALVARRLIRQEALKAAVEHANLIDRIVENAYKLILSRTPTDTEKNMGIRFLQDQILLVGSTKELAAFLGKQENNRTSSAQLQLEMALSDYCLVLLNLDEFMFY